MAEDPRVRDERARQIYAKVQEHYRAALNETRRLAQKLDADSALRARAKVPSNPPPPPSSDDDE